MSQISGLPDAQLTVGAVAARLGVAPATLRTWGHRYGLGPSGHAAGKHRRYTAEDVARLDLLRKLMLNGVTVSEAAKIVAQADVDLTSVAPAPDATSTPDATSAPDATSTRKRFHIVADGEVTDDQEAIVNPTQNLSAENVVALDSAKSSVRALTRAAQMLDSLACERIIETVITNKGIIWAWTNVIHPVLVVAGEHWEKTGEGVEVEHILSEALTAQFKRVASGVQEPVNARPIVLACAPHDMHTLPIYAIAAALAEHGIATRVLGPRMPGEALALACNRLGPSAVVVWSQTVGTADLDVWKSLSNQRPAPLKMSAGPGWSDELPEGVVGSRDFASTLVELAAAAGQFHLSG